MKKKYTIAILILIIILIEVESVWYQWPDLSKKYQKWQISKHKLDSLKKTNPEEYKWAVHYIDSTNN